MVAHNSARRGSLLNGQTLLLAAALLIPGLAPSYFGWMSGLMAIPAFILLAAYGSGQGTLYIRNGALLALAAAIVLKQLPSALFALTLVPIGFSFNWSATARENEWRTGLRASLVLCGCWLAYWFIYGTINEINPYIYLLEILDAGFAQTYTYYMNSSDLPAENLLQIEQAVNQLRAFIPSILPGILICTVITTVWINLLGSISLLERLHPGRLPWARYSQWRLPDQMVWIATAAAALLVFGRGAMANVASSTALVCGLLYFFQGLAVFIHFLEKWKVPFYMRFFFYAILVLQSYGVVLLAITGLTDVWFDFRQRHDINNQQHNDEVE